MAFAKTLSLALFVTLSVALLSAGVNAQKKDANAPLATVTSAPITLYSEVRREALLNSFQVVTLERPDATMIKCDLIVRAGAMFDLADRVGLAALTQAALMAVNPRVKEEFESLNAKIDWGVTPDVTWFHLESPVNNFDTAMEIFARLLIVENVRPDAMKKAQADQVAKLKNTQPTPAQRADEAFYAALYGTHPYGHNVDGNEKTINAMKPGDLYDFVKRFYLSNNAFAVVTGPVKQDRILRTFKTFLGSWTKSGLIPATFRAPQRVAELKLIKIEAADVPHVELRGGVLGVRYGDTDYLATELLGRVLAARFKSAGLNNVTVHTPKYMLAAPLYFATSATAEQAQTVSRQATDVFASLASQAITDGELAAAKAALATDYAARPAEQFLLDIETFTLAKNYPLNLNQAIGNVTVADAQRVARRLLESNALTVVVLGRVNDLKSQL